MELSGVNQLMKRCGKMDADLGPGLRMRQYRPGSQVIITIITAAIRCRMSGHCGPSQGIKRSRRFYEQIHSTYTDST